MSEWKDEQQREQEQARKSTASDELGENVEKVACAVGFLMHATHDDHISCHWPSVKAAWNHLEDEVAALGASMRARGELHHGEKDPWPVTR